MAEETTTESFAPVAWGRLDAAFSDEVWAVIPGDARRKISAAYGSPNVLAQRLHDEGLVFAINRLILHPLGLALGFHAAEVDENVRGKVRGMFILDNGEELEFDDAAVRRNLQKLRDAGHDGVANLVIAQDEMLAGED